MNQYIKLINNPFYIAIIITILVFITNIIDNKIQNNKTESFIDTFRKSLYSGVISGSILYILESSNDLSTDKIIVGQM
jgi:hypothetical protein